MFKEIAVVQQPAKLVVLDTATLSAMAANPLDSLRKQLLSILHTGDWIPYLTWHHLEELISHGSDNSFRSRVGLISRLPHLAYILPAWEDTPFGGSVLDLRHYEIKFLLEHPRASHQDVIDGVWSLIRGGYTSGARFVEINQTWWEIYRRDFAESRRQLKEQIANVTHFLPTDQKERLPPAGQHETFVSDEAANKLRKQMAANLASSLVKSGDIRQRNPFALADDFAAAMFDMSNQLRSLGPTFTDSWLQNAGVSRDRLPPFPTVEDAGYEATFVEQMRVFADKLSVVEANAATQLRKEDIPSWVVWEQVNRRIKQIPHAEIGNVNDLHIVSFGLYVDVLNVDKRIAELLRQAGSHHALLLNKFTNAFHRNEAWPAY